MRPPHPSACRPPGPEASRQSLNRAPHERQRRGHADVIAPSRRARLYTVRAASPASRSSPMSPSLELVARIAAAAAVFAVMALWEVLAPRRPWSVGRLARWPHNLGIV